MLCTPVTGPVATEGQAHRARQLAYLVLAKVQQLQSQESALHGRLDVPLTLPQQALPQAGGQAHVGVLPQTLVPLFSLLLSCSCLQQGPGICAVVGRNAL